eukprot:Awhi_evm1s9177
MSQVDFDSLLRDNQPQTQLSSRSQQGQMLETLTNVDSQAHGVSDGVRDILINHERDNDNLGINTNSNVSNINSISASVASPIPHHRQVNNNAAMEITDSSNFENYLDQQHFLQKEIEQTQLLLKQSQENMQLDPYEQQHLHQQQLQSGLSS